MTIPLASILGRVTALPASYLVMWAALAVLTIGLVVLMRTRWGRERPTPRYVLLSIVGHLLLICVATTIRFLSTPAGEAALAPVKVRIVMRSAPVAAQPEPVAVAKPSPSVVTETIEPPIEPAPEAPPLLGTLPVDPIDTPVEPPVDTPVEPPPIESPPEPAEPIEAAEKPPLPPEKSERAAVDQPSVDSDQVVPIPPAPLVAAAEPEPAVTPIPEFAPQATSPQWQSGVTAPVAVVAPPTAYGARTMDERWRLVEREGGSRETEDAVAAALEWLVAAQSNDGRWDARRWSAGRERRVLGHDRKSAGVNADTGVSGLALLALMGAGHSHTEEGPYAEAIRRGLEFLLRSQKADGDLAGEATQYARTYCHSMAAFALAEALAHTRDQRLATAVERAVRFLVDGQDRVTGGWRYKPGQPGDMSQMGWVIMALRSAELGGVEPPPATWVGIERFVDSVQRGQSGGLACYRRDGPISRTMTAEALYCRQILGAPISQPAGDESAAALLGGPPGAGQANLYYWYYATLALHHHRGANGYADTAWEAWHDALTRSLVASQVREGGNRGSWSPNTVWGGYGGRVYATAMAAMCLEVYYRYDPQQLVRDPWIAARPGNGTLR